MRTLSFLLEMPRRLRFSLAASELHPRLSLHREGGVVCFSRLTQEDWVPNPVAPDTAGSKDSALRGTHWWRSHQAATRVTAQQLTFRIGRRGLAGGQGSADTPHPNPHHRQLAGVGLGRSTGRAWRKAQPRAAGEFYYCGWRSRLPWRPTTKMRAPLAALADPLVPPRR